MIDSICDKNLCIGCAACKNVCPQGAVTMSENEEGFLYPFVDGKLCVDCNVCKNICPINSRKNDDGVIPEAYAVQNADEVMRENSSSGGVFTLISEYIIDQGGFVYGSGFDDRFNVVHKVCKKKEDLSELMGSKYVQSDTRYIFKEIEERLKNNEKVLFTGTPCQIGALKAFLKKDYPDLYTQDIICHGVPSPLVWRKYIAHREKVAGSTVKNITFRNKRTGWKTYSVTFGFSDGKNYSERLVNDPYMRIFLQDLSIRRSCYDCAFKTYHRQADITLGDFWGLKDIVPEFDDDKGTSLVLIHSEKGKELLDAIRPRVRIKKTDFAESVKRNPSVAISAQKPVLRKKFFLDLRKLDFEKLNKKYCDSGLLSRIRRKLAGMIASLGDKNEG